jgi:DNA modification methylase
MTTILVSEILTGDRGRKTYGDLTGLKNSLAAIGSIHPIVLSHEEAGAWGDSCYILVAGGRRLAALKELGITELHHGSVLNPQKLGFVFENEVSEATRKEAELDENLYRLKPKWFEDIVLIADVHKLKQEQAGGPSKWGLRQTAELLGPGYGLANVSYAVRLAKLIRSGDSAVLDCDTMSDAISLLVKRKEDEALAELQKRALPASVTSMSSFLDTLNISLTKKTLPATKDKESQVGSTPTDESVLVDGSSPSVAEGSPVTIPLSQMFVLGDCIEVMKGMASSCIDHVVTDIPYGIDMKNLDTNVNIEDVSAEHEVEANVDLMRPFLEQAFRLTKSGGFCVFFYDLDHHEKLQAWAKDVGWRVQRWPLIAHKTSSCQNNAAQYNFTKNYESIMVLRRDEKTVLRGQQPSSVWTGDFAAERRLYNNAFAKPFDLWKWIYSAVAFQGQTVLDPFCGEMSACRAAVNCGLVPFGIEVKEQHYNRGLENMRKVYALVHKSNCVFT